MCTTKYAQLKAHLILDLHYLTCPVMWFGMHYGQQWAHFQQGPQLWTLNNHFLQVWPVLAGNIRAEESHILPREGALQVQRVGKYIPSENIEGLEKSSMSTDCYLKALFVDL